MKYPDSEIWNACAEVLPNEESPLEVSRVAKAAKMDENEVIAALIRESGQRGEAVTFRYPPIPTAAIKSVGTVTYKRATIA